MALLGIDVAHLFLWIIRYLRQLLVASPSYDTYGLSFYQCNDLPASLSDTL